MNFEIVVDLDGGNEAMPNGWFSATFPTAILHTYKVDEDKIVLCIYPPSLMNYFLV